MLKKLVICIIMAVFNPTKYIRKMYKDNLNSILPIYDSLAPAGASVPYGVITNISTVEKPIRDKKEWYSTVTLILYNEFQENGGMLLLDNKAQEILNLLVPENFIYLSIENFSHIVCKVLNGPSNGTIDVGAVTVYTNTLVIEHLVKQTS